MLAVHKLCADIGCSQEDLPSGMIDKKGWREREREIQGDPCYQQTQIIYIYIYLNLMEHNRHLLLVKKIIDICK